MSIRRRVGEENDATKHTSPPIQARATKHTGAASDTIETRPATAGPEPAGPAAVTGGDRSAAMTGERPLDK